MEAVQGGADVIDAKEPTRGAMGPVDTQVLQEIAVAVEGRSLTAAAGELHELDRDWIDRAASVPALRLIKVGLSQANDRAAGLERVAALQAELPPRLSVAPVLYADLASRALLDVDEVLNEASLAGLQWLVIDTFDKQSGRLFDWWSPPRGFALQSAKVKLALAGRLTASDLERAVSLRPLLIGVRSLVCGGDRDGSVQRARVASTMELMRGG